MVDATQFARRLTHHDRVFNISKPTQNMNLSLKTVALFALIVVVAYAPTFVLDGDEWIKSGAGATGLALVALFSKLLVVKEPEDKKKTGGDDY